MKISIVTPSFNSARHIKETIQSVIFQSGNFTIEYFVVDNCSTDGTREIIENFQRLLKSDTFKLGCNGVELNYVSEPDTGMYEAINKGFAKATGEVFAWINADDIYLPGAFATIVKIFTNYDDVHWVTGTTSFMTEESIIYRTGRCLIYAQDWIKSGIYGRDLYYFVAQESVFWRSWLWKKCGDIDVNLKLAGDYSLWIKFSELVPLVSVKSLVSCFRRVEGQLSQDLAAYLREAKNLSSGKNELSSKVRLYFRLEIRLPRIFRPFIFRLMFGRPSFSAILISSEGKLNKITSEHYEVSRLL